MLRLRTRAALRVRGPISRTFATAVDSPTGLKVASVHAANSPTSSITILANAGSRYETSPGVASGLKNFAFKGSAKRSALATIREAELYGGFLSSSLSREHLALTAEFLPGQEAVFMDILSSFVTSGKFARHEFTEYVQPLMQSDAEELTKNPALTALESAHQLAFHGSGLGASLYAPAHGGPTHTDIKNYASQVFQKGNMAVLATGIEESSLVQLVDKHLAPSLKASSGTQAMTSAPSQYFGGQSRIESHSGPETVFFGYGVSGPPSLPLLALLSHISPVPHVKWSTSSVSSPISSLLPVGVSVQPVYLPYSDATLCGFLVQGPEAAQVTTANAAVVTALQGTASSIKAEELKTAIVKAKFHLATLAEGRSGLVAAVGPNVLNGNPTSLDASFSALDALTPSTFSKSVSDLVKSKPTFVAVGKTSSLPFMEDLGL